ncbi:MULTISPECIES: hypothetical protein [unclassified Oceanispirochaeta]|uniref:hypothetical protein n=1 Tax=unclassified Oceanispirochaeta TaxID=2635722 RepID=UPI000E09A67B|nr:MULTISPECIES: hypothetical protein [unclassified Oceanispirochaeta]MBF9014925.1 hypothetical protein [Oceanispirochaeta sp. M2]NPD71394.1 hypothetical protein [Oceanispirochaeta sp. M1]RDG33359.1 hypothetical protein DV872_04695 [Oceanispirochaeta sp. M1]
MKKVLVIGEILVEVKADEMDQSFLSTGHFSGPYASGAPVIFIDQVAKLDAPATILSAVGDDYIGTFHIMGSSIFNKEMYLISQEVMKLISPSCILSFDPNIRPGILNSDP